MGSVVAIYICPDAGQPMQRRQRVRAIAETGLEGDRYAMGKGIFSKGPRVTTRHVSLIALEAIDAANRLVPDNFSFEETRRNIVTEGIDLNALVGKRFLVGPVCMRGVELCDPCTRPSKLAGKEGFKEAFEQRGGLRAAIVSTGEIAVGDRIVIIER